MQLIPYGIRLKEKTLSFPCSHPRAVVKTLDTEKRSKKENRATVSLSIFFPLFSPAFPPLDRRDTSSFCCVDFRSAQSPQEITPYTSDEQVYVRYSLRAASTRIHPGYR